MHFSSATSLKWIVEKGSLLALGGLGTRTKCLWIGASGSGYVSMGSPTPGMSIGMRDRTTKLDAL